MSGVPSDTGRRRTSPPIPTRLEWQFARPGRGRCVAVLGAALAAVATPSYVFMARIGRGALRALSLPAASAVLCAGIAGQTCQWLVPAASTIDPLPRVPQSLSGVVGHPPAQRVCRRERRVDRGDVARGPRSGAPFGLRRPHSARVVERRGPSGLRVFRRSPFSRSLHGGDDGSRRAHVRFRGRVGSRRVAVRGSRAFS